MLLAPEATVLLATKGAFLHKPSHVAPRQLSRIDYTAKQWRNRPAGSQFPEHLPLIEAGPNKDIGSNSRSLCFQNCSECKEKRAAHILCTYCNRWLCSSCTEEHRHGPVPGGPLFPRAQKGSPGISPPSTLPTRSHALKPCCSVQQLSDLVSQLQVREGWSQRLSHRREVSTVTVTAYVTLGSPCWGWEWVSWCREE